MFSVFAVIGVTKLDKIYDKMTSLPNEIAKAMNNTRERLNASKRLIAINAAQNIYKNINTDNPTSNVIDNLKNDVCIGKLDTNTKQLYIGG